MNDDLILGMIKPYVKNNLLSFGDFKNLFSFLSRREQYEVVDILIANNIDFISDEGKKYDYDKGTISEEEDVIELNECFEDDEFDDDSFDEKYDDSLFKDKSKDDGFVLYTSPGDVKQSNDILCKLYQEGNQQAKHDLCIKNRRLVSKYAHAYEKYYGNHLSYEDIEQAGMIGLLKAAERFDYLKGFQFSTYATWWIRQAIVREIYDHGFAIRVPVHMMERINKVTSLDNKYAGMEYTYDQRMKAISDEMRMPVEFVEYCLVLRRNYISYSSLDTPVGEEEETPLIDLVLDSEATSIEDQVAYVMLKEQLKEVLKTLTQREQKVLRLRFGLDDGRARTLDEVGKEFNVTRERIRQIEAKALRKLRHPSRSRIIKDYLDE